jgi:hypothetical protein
MPINRKADKETECRPWVCIGHSHVEAISAAAARAAVPLECFNFWTHSLTLVGPPAIEFLRGLDAKLRAPVYSFIGGGAHHVFGLIVHRHRPYDFILPEKHDLPLADGTELVPYEVVHAALYAHSRPFFELMDEMKALTDGPMFHFDPPPPPFEEHIAADELQGWLHFHDKNDVLAPAWFRYKLWYVNSKILRAHCKQAGIVFVPAPPESIDKRGFLKEAYRGKPGHGNTDYGALVLRQMQKLSGSESIAQRVRRAIFG